MTGGTVVILGATGRNLAAGMSGGTAYVLDMNHSLYKRLNKQLVTMSEVSDEHDVQIIKSLVEKHVKETGSALGAKILKDFEKEYLPHFKKIIPNDYHKMLVEISRAEERGLKHDEAVLEAFYAATGQKRVG